MDTLDDKDRKLLNALRKNSRASLVSLGRDIGLSRSATHDRITRLEEHGVIKGYTILIDDAFAPKTCAFLTVQFDQGCATRAMSKRLSEISGVVATYCLAGDIDTLVYCECENITALSALREEIERISGVHGVQTRPLLSSHGKQ